MGRSSNYARRKRTLPGAPCCPLLPTIRYAPLREAATTVSKHLQLALTVLHGSPVATSAQWKLLGRSAAVRHYLGQRVARAAPLTGGREFGLGRPARSSTCPMRQEGQKHADRGLRREGTLGAERLRHLTPCYTTARYHVLIGRPEDMFLTGTSQPRIAFLCGLRCHIKADISIVRQIPSCLSGPVVAHRSQVVTAALAFVKRRV